VAISRICERRVVKLVESPEKREKLSLAYTGGSMYAYHGTPNSIPHHILSLGAVTHSERGSFGSGFYLADYFAAIEYANDGDVHAFWVERGKLFQAEASYEVGEQFDLETAALPLISALFSVPLYEAAELFRRWSCCDGLLGDEIKQQVKRLGFDGVWLDYGLDDCFEAVVYDSQITQYLKTIQP